jgi:hypothetical protein
MFQLFSQLLHALYSVSRLINVLCQVALTAFLGC